MIKLIFISFSVIIAFQCVAQVPTDIIFDNLSSDFKYELRTKDFYKLNGANNKETLGDSIKLGCSEFDKVGIPIAFMIELKEKKKITRKHLRQKGVFFGKPPHSMQLFVVKRVDYELDERIINALDYYCHYGQNNYYFMTNEYLLFTYSISGDYLFNADMERMATIENKLVKNLNEIKK